MILSIGPVALFWLTVMSVFLGMAAALLLAAIVWLGGDWFSRWRRRRASQPAARAAHPAGPERRIPGRHHLEGVPRRDPSATFDLPRVGPVPPAGAPPWPAVPRPAPTNGVTK